MEIYIEGQLGLEEQAAGEMFNKQIERKEAGPVFRRVHRCARATNSLVSAAFQEFTAFVTACTGRAVAANKKSKLAIRNHKICGAEELLSI